MRRLYSTFAGGWPGIGLLVMRLVVGSVLLVRTGQKLWSDPPLHLTLTSASLAISGASSRRWPLDACGWSSRRR